MAERMVKKIILLILLLLVFACSDNWYTSLPNPWTLSEEQISELLPQFYEHYPKFEDRLKAIVLWRIGTPYEEFKLGEETPPDDDPLFRLDVSDCTVHVLTSLALAQSRNWTESKENMINIHYKEDEFGNITPSYDTRWHFTTERIHLSPYTYDISEELFEPGVLKNVDISLNEKSDGTSLLEMNWSKNLKISYIQNSLIDQNLLRKLPKICGIAFVRESYLKNGLLVAHEGILLDRKDLVHASSEYGKTVNVNFLEYYFRNGEPRFDGIMVYKFDTIY